ncbi:radical SAM protein [Candidatus Bathyarchaeota archaeon]|nr:radical SAM protein [Candidatus Bathyarchaeota archaeon]
MIPDTFRVGLLLTEQCNIACRHCWFNCSPEKTSNMKLDEAYSCIDQAIEIPTVEWISFTGGEPFLLYGMMKTLIEYASSKGLKTECVTNCFWAESEEGAENILKRLVKSGLDVINISVDDFHQEHIPFTRVKNCYQASKALGLKIVIMSASARTNKLRLEKITDLLGRDEILTRQQKGLKSYSAIAIETCFLPVGRGADIPESELLVGSEPTGGPCKSVLRDVAVTPSGEVLPCCSVAGLLDIMRLGNILNMKLKDALEEASRRKLFRILSDEGPEGLLKLLSDNASRGYVSRCHMCYEVLREASSSNFYSTF